MNVFWSNLNVLRFLGISKRYFNANKMPTFFYPSFLSSQFLNIISCFFQFFGVWQSFKTWYATSCIPWTYPLLILTLSLLRKQRYASFRTQTGYLIDNLFAAQLDFFLKYNSCPKSWFIREFVWVKFSKSSPSLRRIMWENIWRILVNLESQFCKRDWFVIQLW